MRLPFGRTSEPIDTTDEQLTARWIEATVADSFRPDEERLGRVRSTVLAAQHLAAARADHVAGRNRSRRGLLAGGMGRRAGILATALVGVLVVSGAAAAQSGPGQPFYGVRLVAESLTLPPDGTPDGVQARLNVLQERLTEMKTAATKGDEKGAAAALGAYRSSLVQLFPSGSPEAVDLHRVAVPGVDLPAVDGRLSDDSTVLETVQEDLAAPDASAATGVLETVGQIRAAIADEVARDHAAHDNAGSGNGLGPRASGPPANGRPSVNPTPTPSPSHRPVDKKKHPMPRATSTPTPAPTS